MKRLRATFILSSFLMIYGTMAFSQGEGEVADISASTGTIRGIISDTTPAQNFIKGVKVIAVSIDGTAHETWTDSHGEYEISGVSPGRYLISIYKDGYRYRLGKPVTVVAGGDHYVPMKMTQKDNLAFFFRKFGLFPGVFLLCFIALVIVSLVFLLRHRR
jgi:hypothetical protein